MKFSDKMWQAYDGDQTPSEAASRLMTMIWHSSCDKEIGQVAREILQTVGEISPDITPEQKQKQAGLHLYQNIHDGAVKRAINEEWIGMKRSEHLTQDLEIAKRVLANQQTMEPIAPIAEIPQ